MYEKFKEITGKYLEPELAHQIATHHVDMYLEDKSEFSDCHRYRNFTKDSEWFDAIEQMSIVMAESELHLDNATKRQKLKQKQIDYLAQRYTIAKNVQSDDYILVVHGTIFRLSLSHQHYTLTQLNPIKVEFFDGYAGFDELLTFLKKVEK